MRGFRLVFVCGSSSCGVKLSKVQWSLYVPHGLAFRNCTFCPHSVFMCFVWIWEQTAIISLYSINWLDFITETGCVYCEVRTGYWYIKFSPVVTICTSSLTFTILRFAHTVYMCFVWIWEQTAIISLHNINCSIFITETECVYCKVRTGSIVTVVTICTTNLTFTNSTIYPHNVFMCFVSISEQTSIISLYSINWLVFITETECVYCAVRTGSSYIIQPSGHYMYHQFNIHKFYVLPTQCIYVFCVDLRTNSDYFPIQH